MPAKADIYQQRGLIRRTSHPGQSLTILKSFVRYLQKHTLLRIHSFSLARGDGEKRCIKMRNVAIDEVAAFHARLDLVRLLDRFPKDAAYRSSSFSTRVIVCSSVPPLWRYSAPTISPLDQELPKAFQRRRVTWKATSHANDGNPRVNLHSRFRLFGRIYNMTESGLRAPFNHYLRKQDSEIRYANRYGHFAPPSGCSLSMLIPRL